VGVVAGVHPGRARDQVRGGGWRGHGSRYESCRGEVGQASHLVTAITAPPSHRAAFHKALSRWWWVCAPGTALGAQGGSSRTVGCPSRVVQLLSVEGLVQRSSEHGG